MTTASPDPLALQATLVDFALAELVRQNRESFQPLWSSESWAKLLIWMALNCGCSGDGYPSGLCVWLACAVWSSLRLGVVAPGGCLGVHGVWSVLWRGGDGVQL